MFTARQNLSYTARIKSFNSRSFLNIAGVCALVGTSITACSHSPSEGGGSDNPGSGSGSETSATGAASNGEDTVSTDMGGAFGAAKAEGAFESVARRLSAAELDNTLRDLFGNTASPATQRLNEDSFDPFDNNYTLQLASSALVDSLELLAEEVAAQALADPDQVAKLVPCSPTGPGDEACFRKVIESVVPQAFRRPLEEHEVLSYLSLLEFAIEQSDFYTAVNLLIRSLISDPEFLYRIEVGTQTAEDGVFSLTSHEIATRMSYLIWGSAPGKELLALAEQGGLTAPDARAAIARSMLDDERARQQVHRFHAMWLGYRAIPHSAELVAAFNQETTALLDRIIFDDERSYLELFTFDETFLSENLASHYGLPSPKDSEGWVPYGESGRLGILSHGSVLSAFSKFSDTSPTQRGLFVQTRLMCNKINPPPANVDVDQAPGDDEADCKQDRYAQHRESASCANCHSLMDPVGLGLENYDMSGAFREHDDGNPDCLIDGTGELPGEGSFSGPGELAEMLVGAQVLDACFVEHYLNFALGRQVNENESRLLKTVTSGFRDDSHSFKQLVIDYIANDAFARRREPQ